MKRKIFEQKVKDLRELLLSLESVSGFDSLCVNSFTVSENSFSDTGVVTIVFSNQSLAVAFYSLLESFNVAYPYINRNVITVNLY